MCVIARANQDRLVKVTYVYCTGRRVAVVKHRKAADQLHRSRGSDTRRPLLGLTLHSQAVLSSRSPARFTAGYRGRGDDKKPRSQLPVTTIYGQPALTVSTNDRRLDSCINLLNSVQIISRHNESTAQC